MALVWESSGSLGGVFLEQEKEWSEIKGAMLLGEVSQMLKALTDILAFRASKSGFKVDFKRLRLEAMYQNTVGTCNMVVGMGLGMGMGMGIVGWLVVIAHSVYR